MNLVSYEFVACQASKKGVLILSEVIHFFYVLFFSLAVSLGYSECLIAAVLCILQSSQLQMMLSLSIVIIRGL